jgi:hypothetical protein
LYSQIKNLRAENRTLRTHSITAEERIEELEALLSDCADDLETLTEHEYRGYRDDAGEMHPAMQPKFERDMELVHRARAVLKSHQK